MLTGEYQHNMDLKGRVTVPSKFREDLGDKFYVCKGLDGCLFLLSQAQWDKLVEKVSAIPLAQGKGIQRSHRQLGGCYGWYRSKRQLCSVQQFGGSNCHAGVFLQCFFERSCVFLREQTSYA